MIVALLHKLFKHRYSIGIDLEFVAKDKLKATLCVLKRVGDELRQIDTLTFDSYPSLFNELKARAHTPIYLNLRGEGVIQHCIMDEKNPAYSKDLLQSLQRLEGLQLRAFAREAFVVSVIDKFKAEKLFVLGVHLGLNIAPMVSVIETARIPLGKHLLNIEDAQIELREISQAGNEKIKGMIQTVDDCLSVSEACSFACALSFVSSENANLQGLHTLEENSKEYSYRHKYNTVLKVSVVFILTLLLGNYLAFDHYFSGNTQLEHRITVSKSELLKIEQKKAELQTKKQFVAVNGLGAPSQLAVYADQLALLLPVDTYLESLNLCPKKKSKRDKQISFDKTGIHITAGTSHTKSINNYIEQIEKLDWVAQVSIASITPDHKIDQLQFSLILKLVQP
jgi:Tfp pilus assembly protein PilN